ncbi:hypothetical protein QBC35DRAFT_112164 [Podospora australis]|uniref:Uncharacterized protein n=1 Tax=Podospora australis TaxID=1536484 RepID=A0AAN7AL51_9PEZI|nr:hypothetical protein QBC35DRAFT_112164 [Podospora australis]
MDGSGSPVAKLPRGTVETRISQLRRRLSRSDPTLGDAYWQRRDLESELLGWGRKLGPDACFVRPATHSTTVDLLRVATPSSSDSTTISVPYKMAGSASDADNHRLAAKWHSRGIPAPSLASAGTTATTITTPTGRRMAARELFDQYNISRPSG